VVVLVDTDLQRSPCMAGARRTRRQTNPRDLVMFDKTLLTAALSASQSTIQTVRRHVYNSLLITSTCFISRTLIRI